MNARLAEKNRDVYNVQCWGNRECRECICGFLVFSAGCLASCLCLHSLVLLLAIGIWHVLHGILYDCPCLSYILALDNLTGITATIVQIPDRTTLTMRQMDNLLYVSRSIVRISGVSLKIWRIVGLTTYELSNTLEKVFLREKYWIARRCAASKLSDRPAECRIFKLI